MFMLASILSAFNAAGDWAGRVGYPAILLVVAGDGVFPLLPGETAIISGATFASSGDLNLLLVILAGTLGAILGDVTAYGIGRAGGERIHRWARRVAGAERVATADRMVRERGSALVFVGRFLPGIRLAINLSAGAGGMTLKRFVTFDAMGALVWATQAALIGYIAGKAFAEKPWLGWLVALAVAGLVGGFIVLRERRMVGRHEARAAADREAEAAARAAPSGAAEPSTSRDV